MTKLLFLRKLYNISNRVQTIIYPSWNLLKFKIKGVNLGKNLNVYTKMFLEIGNGASVTIGDNFIFSSDNCINPLCRNIRGCIVAYPNSSIIIGKNVGMSSPCIWARSSIKIGNNVKIGGDCIIMDSDAHSLNYEERRDPIKDQTNRKDIPITIEDDVLIGTRCIILKGVTIGARSIIGSGSVVTKSIPANCIAAGNPCKVIRYINEE